MAEKSPIAQWLGRVPLFRTLTEKQLRSLEKTGAANEFQAGAFVVRKGDRGIGFYLILDGEVEVRQGSRALATLGPGQFFGEMALLDEEPRSADVVATKPTRCLVLSAWEFWGFATDKPELVRALFAEVGRRLRRTDQMLSE